VCCSRGPATLARLRASASWRRLCPSASRLWREHAPALPPQATPRSTPRQTS
jgi:hypothetical protein